MDAYGYNEDDFESSISTGTPLSYSTEVIRTAQDKVEELEGVLLSLVIPDGRHSLTNRMNVFLGSVNTMKDEIRQLIERYVNGPQKSNTEDRLNSLFGLLAQLDQLETDFHEKQLGTGQEEPPSLRNSWTDVQEGPGSWVPAEQPIDREDEDDGEEDYEEEDEEGSGRTEDSQGTPIHPESEGIEEGVCPICEIPLEKDLTIQLLCRHSYCADCLCGHYIPTKIRDGDLDGLVCPDPSCRAPIGDEDIELLSPPEMFEKYQRFKFLNSIDSNPKVRWCPNPKCGTVVEIEDTFERVVTCIECNLTFCFSCGEKAHVGSCRTPAVILSMGESEKEEERDSNLVKCPLCRAWILRDEGCNKVKCRICYTSFCFLCGEEIFGVSYSHFANCKGYREPEKEEEENLSRWNILHPALDVGLVAGLTAGSVVAAPVLAVTSVIGVPASFITGWLMSNPDKTHKGLDVSLAPFFVLRKGWMKRKVWKERHQVGQQNRDSISAEVSRARALAKKRKRKKKKEAKKTKE